MKVFSIYKKLTLANFLNWFAIRLLRIVKVFSAKLISIAIYLNPNRKIFRENLKSITNTPYYGIKRIEFPFYSVAEGCKLLSQNINFFDVDKTVQLTKPVVLNKDFHVSEGYICEAKLPNTYLAKIKNATVFAGTDLIIVDNKILYDEIDKEAIGLYDTKPRIIDKVSANGITIKMPIDSTVVIKKGIHFVKDHSKNYFHWLVECLPRLSLIDQLDKTIPLLVDYGLPEQLSEALNLFNLDGRPIIKIIQGKKYAIEKLYYPSQLSLLHDNYGAPNYNKDVIYSPTAIKYVRDSALMALNIPSIAGYRKIYISRKNSDYRQLLNSTEIENLLVKYGFEILFTENLSFMAQVEVFSQAKIIVGQSGAGMANFIFAPKNCKVLMMISNATNTNLHGFHMLAESLGISLKFLIGKSTQIAKKYILHADFYIDTKLLLDQLKDIDK